MCLSSSFEFRVSSLSVQFRVLVSMPSLAKKSKNLGLSIGLK